MNNIIPRTPFSTPLSGSARVTELRIKNILTGPKKRPPALFLAAMFAVCLFCGNLVSCQAAEAEPPHPDIPVDWENLTEPDLTLAPVDWDSLPTPFEPDALYTLEENGNVLITNLGDAIVEWNRSSTGNFLYFAQDPAFCCPSLAGRAVEGSALWQSGAVSVSISVNDDRLEDGTIGGYHLQFVAACSDWTVLESEFTSDVGDGTLELSKKEMVYAAQVLADLMREAEWTATADVTVLPQQPDLNRNGVPEELRLFEHEGAQRLDVLENGTSIYSEEGVFAHAGYNAVFLCVLEGEDYLLSYSPIIYQWDCGYSYQLFTLENGLRTVVRENGLSFDINFQWPSHRDFDPEAIDAFIVEINELLSHSVQLLNTDDDLTRTFEKEGRLEDTLWWLDGWEPIFVRDPDKTLLENLRDFQRSMERAAGQP
ncbi:hypothetical protein D1641_03310 [Colidextribacter sp. OB.20]|uniref:hypothetical protein n=1 Tax=Colidextribacter sp. OB.20 TaxID=2304568 RepID=UPI00136C558C|nr:hypothetical protein [Colidextribacter sp. OB.20]NBI09050.1 hypothetical protein [Colidextribacter sp. OB.20]